jgi:predicted Zn-dependent protease
MPGTIGCVMHFSNSLADTDRKVPGFCHSCRLRLLADLALP